jgi:hypothetical protein
LENTKRELQGRHLLNFCVLFGKHESRALVLVEKHEKESSSKSMQKKIFEESSSKYMRATFSSCLLHL